MLAVTLLAACGGGEDDGGFAARLRFQAQSEGAAPDEPVVADPTALRLPTLEEVADAGVPVVSFRSNDDGKEFTISTCAGSETRVAQMSQAGRTFTGQVTATVVIHEFTDEAKAADAAARRSGQKVPCSSSTGHLNRIRKEQFQGRAWSVAEIRPESAGTSKVNLVVAFTTTGRNILLISVSDTRTPGVDLAGQLWEAVKRIAPLATVSPDRAGVPPQPTSPTCRSLMPLDQIRAATGVDDLTVRPIDDLPGNLHCVVENRSAHSIEVLVDAKARTGGYVDEVAAGTRPGWAERRALPGIGDRAFGSTASGKVMIVAEAKGMVVDLTDNQGSLSLDRLRLLAAVIMGNLPSV